MPRENVEMLRFFIQNLKKVLRQTKSLLFPHSYIICNIHSYIMFSLKEKPRGETLQIEFYHHLIYGSRTVYNYSIYLKCFQSSFRQAVAENSVIRIDR